MSTKAILVVDDIKENVDILVEQLSPHYGVKVALNGKTALKIAEKTRPDLILLDIIMPEMDGYQVLQELKAKEATAAIPVVFVSSDDTAEEKEKGRQLGAAGHLSKPADRNLLLETCRKFLGEPVG